MLTTAHKAVLTGSTALHVDLQNLLKSLAEPGYQKFASALLPGTTNLLGVRLPHLRQIAGVLAKGDWEYYLSKPTDTYFEETMLQGMVIGLISKKESSGVDWRKPQTQMYLKAFIPRINNWSVCDSFCAGLKFAKTGREETWTFLMACLNSDQEFEFRFGAVMLLNHYMTDDWIDPVLEALFTHHPKDYYAKMAVAWALSQAFAFDPRKTLTQIEQRWSIGMAADLDEFVRQKTFQKILESNKVSTEYKSIIRAMKEGEVVAKTKSSKNPQHFDDREKLAAVLSSDPSFDGQFFYAVKSTGIYCRPSCKSKAPKTENISFFDSSEDAIKAGYRPCKRCRPDLLAYDPHTQAAEALHKAIDAHLLEQETLMSLVKTLGGHQPSVKNAFKKRCGCLPAELITQKRLSLAADGLRNTTKPILQIALDCGFSSQSTFYVAFRREYHMSPGKYRKEQIT